MRSSSNSFIKTRLNNEAYFFIQKKLRGLRLIKSDLHDSLLLPTMAVHLHLALYKALYRVVGAISLALEFSSSPHACEPFVGLHHLYIIPSPYRGLYRTTYLYTFYFFYTLPYCIYFVRCHPSWFGCPTTSLTYRRYITICNASMFNSI